MKIFFIILFAIAANAVFAQQKTVDSLDSICRLERWRIHSPKAQMMFDGKTETTSITITREQLEKILDSLAYKIKEDHPDAAKVLFSLLSTMYMNQEKVLAKKALEVTGKLIEEKTKSNSN